MYTIELCEKDSQKRGRVIMRTWQDYKNYIKSIDSESQRDMEQIEELSAIVSSIIKWRNELGISQIALAEQCGITQSSVARIETF